MTRLSICIPTFQRAASLRRLLAQLLPQCSRGDVEVVISDNGSSDDTEAVCLATKTAFAYVKYVRQSENKGFALNLLAAVTAASGDYIWLLGDDDDIHSDAVARIVTYLEGNTVSVLLLNFARHSDTDRSHARPEFCIGKDLAGLTLDSLLTIAGVWASFMSICIVNAHLAKQCLTVNAIGHSSYAGFWLMLCAGKGGGCAVLANPLVMRRRGRWERHRFLAWETYLLHFAEPINWATMVGAISQATRRTLLGRMCRGFASYVVVHTRLRGGSIEPLSLVLREHRGVTECWLLLIPLAVMPLFVLRIGLAVIGYAARMFRCERLARVTKGLSP